MMWIYDILLNFIDSERLVEFYEWNDKDNLEHIKKIPLFKIDTKDLEKIINYRIKVSRDFLEKIEDKTQLYKNKKTIKYAALFTDLNKVVALEFDDMGNVNFKSSLLIDEEEDIISECGLLENEKIKYEIKEKYEEEMFLTREERFKRNYLVHEIKNAYKNKALDKLNYFYEELYKKDDYSIDEKYGILIRDLIENYNNIHTKLFEIVRLSYSKK